MPIKTFRGLIADGVQDIIVLHTNTGSTGYRIVKFELLANAPGTANYESIVKIYKINQNITPSNPTTGIVDFSDNTLLGTAYLEGSTSTTTSDTVSVIFDREIFNQDIYVTHSEVEGSAAVNYYIELEQVKLDLNENTVATLKDIRNLS